MSVLLLQILTFSVAIRIVPGIDTQGILTPLIGSFVYAILNTILTSIFAIDSGDSFYGLLIQQLMIKRSAPKSDTPGLIIIQIDGDLQQDSEDILKLLPLLSTHDLVCGWRQQRQDGLVKMISSKIASRVRNLFTHDVVYDTGCPLKVFRRAVLERIRLYEGMHRFFPALAAMHDRGETEPIDPRAGHVPGARNAPWTDNLTDDAVPVFRPREQLRARYEALGAARQEAVVYCGSGVTACHDLLALHLAGLRGTLYAGSWSEWSSDPTLPAATGSE